MVLLSKPNTVHCLRQLNRIRSWKYSKYCSCQVTEVSTQSMTLINVESNRNSADLFLCQISQNSIGRFKTTVRKSVNSPGAFCVIERAWHSIMTSIEGSVTSITMWGCEPFFYLASPFLHPSSYIISLFIGEWCEKYREDLISRMLRRGDSVCDQQQTKSISFWITVSLTSIVVLAVDLYT